MSYRGEVRRENASTLVMVVGDADFVELHFQYPGAPGNSAVFSLGLTLEQAAELSCHLSSAVEERS